METFSVEKVMTKAKSRKKGGTWQRLQNYAKRFLRGSLKISELETG